MSITDELREYVRHYSVAGSSKDKTLVAIADRIDAEHQKAAAGCIHYDPERHYCSVHGDTENGWVRLPKDADGELILDGDKMVAPHGDVFIVTHMMLENGTWTVHGWKPSFLHHHKSPVEDVLYELTNRLFDDDESATDKELIAEYAAKLRLTGDWE